MFSTHLVLTQRVVNLTLIFWGVTWSRLGKVLQFNHLPKGGGRYNKPISSFHMCWGLNSRLFPCSRGWENQPHIRGLYTHCKDSLLKVGWCGMTIQYKEFRPWLICSIVRAVWCRQNEFGHFFYIQPYPDVKWNIQPRLSENHHYFRLFGGD